MRGAIADGSAKVIGTKMIDNDEYWVVQTKVDGDDGGDLVETVTMRKSDYRVGSWLQVNHASLPGDKKARYVVTKQAALQVVEQLDPNSLPSGFFSFNAVRAAAKAAIPAKKP